jgi:large subunit ribosomal protein L22
MEIKYSKKPANESKAVKALGRDLDISFKDAVTLSNWVSGKNLSTAAAMLEAVVSLKRAVPYPKYNKGVGHRRGNMKVKTARYPKKAASAVLDVVKNLQSNAEYRGLDAEKLKLTHIQAQKGVVRKRKKPKGRYRTWKREFVHVQAVAEEK